MYQSSRGPAGHAGTGRNLRRRGRGSRRSAGLPSRSCSRRSAKSSGCRTTRSALAIKDISTTPARSWSRPGRSRRRAARLGRAHRHRKRAARGDPRGANMNFDRLRFVAERAELGEAREALFGVTIPERPGAFREFWRHHRPKSRDRVNYRLSGATGRISSSASPPARSRTPRSWPHRSTTTVIRR